jgi:hypothetical protein
MARPEDLAIKQTSAPVDVRRAMTSKDAISAHVNWKLRIHALLSGKLPDKLDPVTIARDNVCDLGKWIHGNAKDLVPGPVYADLKAAHADFHREASRIVREVYAGRPIGMEAIDADSPFGKLTTRVVGILSRLNIA